MWNYCVRSRVFLRRTSDFCFTYSGVFPVLTHVKSSACAVFWLQCPHVEIKHIKCTALLPQPTRLCFTWPVTFLSHFSSSRGRALNLPAGTQLCKKINVAERCSAMLRLTDHCQELCYLDFVLKERQGKGQHY